MTHERIRHYIALGRKLGHADGLAQAMKLAVGASQVLAAAGEQLAAEAMVRLASVLGEESNKKAAEVANGIGMSVTTKVGA